MSFASTFLIDKVLVNPLHSLLQIKHRREAMIYQ